MDRLIYLLLGVPRVYFAFCASYLHPDEHFQGPEVVAGYIFSQPAHKTWEFTAAQPIRSLFPLWPIYGFPLTVLRWVSKGFGDDVPNPVSTFHLLRAVMLILSFALEDRAIYRLAESPQHRRLAMLLVSSSYVTWTWQVHTFSNSLETLALVSSLVLIQTLRDKSLPRPQQLRASACLGALCVFGVFNRITFPAFLAAPILLLFRDLAPRPWVLLPAGLSAIATAFAAIFVDSKFYLGHEFSIKRMMQDPIITPLNSLLYNTKHSNLSSHGLHPYYQHLVANLPQLVGPAIITVFMRPRSSIALASLVSGVGILSLLPHQEARFLVPAVPLILLSTRLPVRFRRAWLAVWITFNACMGLLMGVYHQGGVVPAQMHLATRLDVSKAFWWKTYSPPPWIVAGKNRNLETIDLMGLNKDSLEERICGSKSQPNNTTGTVLVAPRSSAFLDRFSNSSGADVTSQMRLTELWGTKSHLNLDDLDIADEGILPSTERLIGRRGLIVWIVDCPTHRHEILAGIQKDW